MMDKFSVDQKIIYSPEIYDKVNTFTYDLPFYLDLSKKANGPVLELCCGTGRITSHLLSNDIDILGLDLSETMLKGARNKISKDIFIKGDMRSFNLDKKFKLIFIPFNSLLNTYNFEDLNLIFNNIKKHLLPDGHFVFDIFNPDFTYLTRDKKEVSKICRFELDSGVEVRIEESMEYDKKHQVNRVKWHHYIGGEYFVERLDMRCYFPQEMDYILKYNNFKIISKFGDFDKSEFSSSSSKQIFVCKL